MNITKLPQLTEENIRDIMAERLAATRNSFTAIPMLWQGLIELTVQVGERSRTATLYIPKDTPQGTTFVLMNVPKGEETLSFLQKSGWMGLADKNELCLCAAEPGPGGWRTQEQEQPYFNACLQAIIEGVYFRGGMSVYVVGYDELGTCLHKEVMSSPLRVAAAAFINASGIDGTYLQEVDASLLDRDGMVFGVATKEIPVPVWIIETAMTPQAEAAVAHWVNAIGASAPKEDPILGKVYRQNKDIFCAPDGNIAQVAVREINADAHVAGLTADICHFLTIYARYNKSGPFGNSLVRRVNYAEMGVDRRFFADGTGLSRECLIYVPKAFQGKGKLPLVFALHGACESTRNYFEESLWYRKAEECGFIVVMPEGSLEPVPKEISNGYTKAYRSLWQNFNPETRHMDLTYFGDILDQVIADYSVDQSRIYCTGHSMGCMTTNFIGSGPLACRFAALAATSAGVRSWDPTGTEIIPNWITSGEYDIWSYEITGDGEIPQTLDKWLVRNGLATQENVRQVRLNGEKRIDGRYNGTLWKNRDGIPLLWYEWVEKKDHMNTPEENYRFWDLWFSKWHLDAEKGRCFEGRPILRKEG